MWYSASMITALRTWSSGALRYDCTGMRGTVSSTDTIRDMEGPTVCGRHRSGRVDRVRGPNDDADWLTSEARPV